MADLAQIQFCGRTCQPPRQVNKHGQATHVVLRMAVNHGYYAGDSWKETGTTYMDVSCWGKLAENVLSSHLGAGTPLMVVGRMDSTTWSTTNPETGEESTRSAFRFTAQHLGPDLSTCQVRTFKTKLASFGQAPEGQDLPGADGSEAHDPWNPDRKDVVGAGAGASGERTDGQRNGNGQVGENNADPNDREVSLAGVGGSFADEDAEPSF